jgi:hypothetical protein
MHGDFHPGNIWFKEAGGQRSWSAINDSQPIADFVLLDEAGGLGASPQMMLLRWR